MRYIFAIAIIFSMMPISKKQPEFVLTVFPDQFIPHSM